MKNTSLNAIFLVGGIIAAAIGFMAAQDGSNLWYVLGVIGLISLLGGAIGILTGKGNKKI